MAYPEQLITLPDVRLLGAFQDAAMVGPHTVRGDAPSALFPSQVVFKLGGDAGLNDASGIVNLPLQNIIITIGQFFGKSLEFCAQDDTSTDPVSIGDIVIPFTVWGSSAQDLDDARPRLYFARDHRKAVFSSHGLTLQGQSVPERRRSVSPTTALFAEDFRWHFFWERT